MDEREFGDRTNADLLMPPKGIVPSRKAKERETILFEERLDTMKKCSLTKRMNVLYDIMHKNDVEAFVLRRWLLRKEKILSDECPPLMEFCKENPYFIDTFLTDVNTCYFTALLCEGEQVSTLATAYFQYAGVRR